MRSNIFIKQLKNAKNNSKHSEQTVELGDELFVYEDRRMSAYTNKAVIDHDTDRLVNLAENPLSFDDLDITESLREMNEEIR